MRWMTLSRDTHESESFQMSCNFHDETTLDELKRHTLETGFEQTFSFESW